MLPAVRRVLPSSARLLRNFALRTVVTSSAAPPQFQFDPVAAAKTAQETENHSLHFKIERYFAAAMVPLFPAAYFLPHTSTMDWLLTFALTLHIHWGVWGVVNDYGRPFVLGDTLAKAVRVGAYVMTICLLAGLIHFNQNDVGLTKAFEKVWTL